MTQRERNQIRRHKIMWDKIHLLAELVKKMKGERRDLIFAAASRRFKGRSTPGGFKNIAYRWPDEVGLERLNKEKSSLSAIAFAKQLLAKGGKYDDIAEKTGLTFNQVSYIATAEKRKQARQVKKKNSEIYRPA